MGCMACANPAFVLPESDVQGPEHGVFNALTAPDGPQQGGRVRGLARQVVPGFRGGDVTTVTLGFGEVNLLEGLAQLITGSEVDLHPTRVVFDVPPAQLLELLSGLVIGLAQRRGQVALAEADDGALGRRALSAEPRCVLLRVDLGEAVGVGARSVL